MKRIVFSILMVLSCAVCALAGDKTLPKPDALSEETRQGETTYYRLRIRIGKTFQSLLQGRFHLLQKSFYHQS